MIYVGETEVARLTTTSQNLASSKDHFLIFFWYKGPNVIKWKANAHPNPYAVCPQYN